ncbi:helicase HerA-like domain-containing protein [Ottowia oryzae]|uniref:ATP-binding protein n=1 Tax=Ottowia oryzae TaxID=2109914 RepID=A0A2S0MH14_9BURK|nr:helicase HerA-like domain-containing protein [Ottowia oryzae]AVO35185.1 ATP-binding protein [Ottowia oryzae]
MAEPQLIAQRGDIECFILPGLANRHGLITGATGTGKTVTLQKIAESFSQIGVPVFMSDVKGDLTGISQTGSVGGKMADILKERGLPAPTPVACPVTLWDVFGEHGHPVRATISDMGPLLLARMLDLNETQSGVLNLVFKIADDNGLLLLDLKDLRSMLTFVADNAKQFTTQYGNVSAASVGAIQRGLLTLESQGGDKFFGEPMLNIDDMMQTVGGKGVVNILSADKLMTSPRLYATFLLWMLSDLYERLPEIGDPEKPKFLFFFDEAHLLFNDAPKALLERIELVVRLVRSKGVGVFFVTQNPIDVPDTVLAQLGNRVQHALRAFTARDQRAVKATAETMRGNPGLDIAQAITELATGEALVSLLDEKGRPSVTQRVYVLPPGSQIGPITDAQRATLVKESLVAGTYEEAVDRESAYEMLAQRGNQAVQAGGSQGAAKPGAPATPGTANAPAPAESGGMFGDLMTLGKEALFGRTGPRGGQYDGLVQNVVKGEMRRMGRELVRGALGSLLGGKRK